MKYKPCLLITPDFKNKSTISMKYSFLCFPSEIKFIANKNEKFGESSAVLNKVVEKSGKLKWTQ